MRPFVSRMTLSSQLALYRVFHGSAACRAVHAVSVPVILFSGCVLLSFAGLDAAGPARFWLHAGTLAGLVLIGATAFVDIMGALMLVPIVLSMTAGARAMTDAVAWPAIVVLALASQALGWFATEVVAHRWLEPTLVLPDGPQDSNLYFRRSYMTGANLGTTIRRLDRVVQFCIAPLAVVQDACVLLGARLPLERSIEAETLRIRLRLAAGAAPFEAPRRRRSGVKRSRLRTEAMT